MTEPRRLERSDLRGLARHSVASLGLRKQATHHGAGDPAQRVPPERLDWRHDDMGIIGWIILGLFAGAIAKVLLPGPIRAA